MSEPQVWIGTSWKMNKVLAEAETFADALAAADADRDPRIQRFVIPPFTMVREVARRLAGTSVKVGAQNMHWADAGAWTGEVSAPMLVDCGLDLVELGHSERREHFGETDETVGRKVAAAVRHGLIPLVCIGETLDERESGRAAEVLETQVRAALSPAAPKDAPKAAPADAPPDTPTGYRRDTDVIPTSRPDASPPPILLAYEPVWAIGERGIPATADYADARHAEIAAVAEEVLGHRVPCLYGGSVNPGNCEELIACPHIDGLFIGRSAWAVEGYLDILARCAATL